MMTGLDGMMGAMIAWMLGFSLLTWLLVLVILALVAVWLFQHLRHGGATEPRSASSRSDPDPRG